MQVQSTTAPSSWFMTTKEARPFLIEEYGYFCFRCSVVPSRLDMLLAVDHIIPVARGGRDTYPNYQFLCGPCNSWKGTQVIDFRPGTCSLDVVWERGVIPLWDRQPRTWQPSPVSRLEPEGDYEWLTVKGAAMRLRTSETSVRRMIQSGALYAERFERPQGAYWRVKLERVEDDPPINEDVDPVVSEVETSSMQAPDISALLVTMLEERTATIDRLYREIADLREQIGRLEGR